MTFYRGIEHDIRPESDGLHLGPWSWPEDPGDPAAKCSTANHPEWDEGKAGQSSLFPASYDSTHMMIHDVDVNYVNMFQISPVTDVP